MTNKEQLQYFIILLVRKFHLDLHEDEIEIWWEVLRAFKDIHVDYKYIRIFLISDMEHDLRTKELVKNANKLLALDEALGTQYGPSLFDAFTKNDYSVCEESTCKETHNHNNIYRRPFFPGVNFDLLSSTEVPNTLLRTCSHPVILFLNALITIYPSNTSLTGSFLVAEVQRYFSLNKHTSQMFVGKYFDMQKPYKNGVFTRDVLTYRDINEPEARLFLELFCRPLDKMKLDSVMRQPLFMQERYLRIWELLAEHDSEDKKVVGFGSMMYFNPDDITSNLLQLLTDNGIEKTQAKVYINFYAQNVRSTHFLDNKSLKGSKRRKTDDA